MKGLEGLKALESLKGLKVLHPEEEVDPELELKLVALNALLNMDEEKAFPILEKIVRESESPKLRESRFYSQSVQKPKGCTPYDRTGNKRPE